MEIIVKKETQKDSYELFEIQEKEDINDKKVQIPVSIGKYSINRLEQELINIDFRLSKLQEEKLKTQKLIDAINNL